VDYRPETNAVSFLDMGHTIRGEHAWNREREGNIKPECGWSAHCRGANNLKLLEATIWKGLGSSEEVW
jgi:hypothetical protein